MTSTVEQLIQALTRLGTTQQERADALQITTRQLYDWEKRGKFPRNVIRLIECGIVTINSQSDGGMTAKSHVLVSQTQTFTQKTE
jgi:hypothetical protein